MNAGTFDRLTHRAASSHTRRHSLAALGAAGLAGAFRTSVGAQSNGSNKLCKKQEKQCIAILSPICQPDDPDCPAAVLQCCKFARKCDIEGFVACLPQ